MFSSFGRAGLWAAFLGAALATSFPTANFSFVALLAFLVQPDFDVDELSLDASGGSRLTKLSALSVEDIETESGSEASCALLFSLILRDCEKLVEESYSSSQLRQAYWLNTAQKPGISYLLIFPLPSTSKASFFVCCMTTP